MKKKLLSLLLVFMVSVSVFHAQDYKFGKVSMAELQETYYAPDSTIGAVVLYKKQYVYVDIAGSNGFTQINEMFERIKIYNKQGFDWATKRIRLYHKTISDSEIVQGLKGYTYNLVDGEIVKDKLKRDGIFQETESDRVKIKTFTLPNVKEGSVIEYSYKIGSPYIGIDDIHFQYTIPINKFDLEVVTSERYVYSKMLNPRSNFMPNIEYGIRNKHGSGYKENIITSNVVNIPLLKDEPMIDNIYNYRAKLMFELISIKSSGHTLKNFATSWEDVVRDINESDYFGGQIKRSKFLKDEIKEIKSQGTDKLVIMRNVFDFIKKEMKWNGRYGKYARNISKSYKEKLGSVAEINLMLVSMLRASGIIAHPVLLSTKKSGIPLIPTVDGLNYVIACAEIGGREILLDATEKYCVPGILPERTLNWEGTLVLEDGKSKKVRLLPTSASQMNIMMNLIIHDDGSVEGKERSIHSDLDALKFRKKYKDLTEEKYIESLINRYNLDDITNFNIQNIDNLDKPIMETYSFEIDEGVDVIGNEMYVSPLFFLKLESNPFKSETRSYPIDFVYPFSRKKMINIKIPEGYEVTSLPKAIKVVLPGGLGSFVFNISETNGGLNVMSTFRVNTPVIPSFNYLELKEFYNQRVMKEAEKVVLSRK